MTDDNTPDETVARYDKGASITVDIKRGTGTRDQDAWTLKGKGPTAEDALDELETELEAVEERLADRVRALQPNGVIDE